MTRAERAGQRCPRRAIGVLGLVLALALSAVAPPGRAAPVAAQTPGGAFIERVLASLSVDERIGQLVMVNFVGSDVDPASDIASLVRDMKVGAVLVTASNGNVVNRGDTAAQLAALTNGLQQRAFEATRRSDGSSEYYLPLLIATDNEGDLFPLTNVTNGYTAIPDNMAIGATWSKQHAQATGSIVGQELSAAGVNMLLGPVADVLDNPRSGGNGDIGVRSFGGNPTWVGELARAYVAGVHAGSEGRMLTVAKHFPGHGGSDRSTDNEVPVVNKSLDQLRTAELAPFAMAVEPGADGDAAVTDAIMVSHIRYRSFLSGGGDLFTGPISLDAGAFRGLMDLPEFAAWRSGHLVMSDSLGVPAVKKWYAQQLGRPGFPNRSVVADALLAGNDLLPLVEFYHDPDHPGWKDNQLPTIQDSILYMREQYQSDPAFRRRADDAVRHVIQAKLRLYPALQLAQAQVDPSRATALAGQGAAEMQSLAEDALTLIQPPTAQELRARLPRGPQSPEKVLIVECWEDCYPYRIKPRLALHEELLALYGPSGKARLKPEDVSTVSFGELDAYVSKPRDPANASTARAVEDASWILFGLTEYNPDARPASGAVKRFLDSLPLDVRNKNLVGIAYNVPYHLDSTEISKLSAYFAMYGKTQASIDAGYRALFGDIAPKGHSPVSIAGAFYNLSDAVQPDPGQPLSIAVYGQDPGHVRDERTIGLVAGPVLDRNGNPVPDGLVVSFTLARGGSAAPAATATARTVDGLAAAQLATSGPGAYVASAAAGAIQATPLELTVGEGAAPAESPASGDQPAGSGGGGSGFPLLALAVGLPLALTVTAGGLGVMIYLRRRGPAFAPAVRGPGADVGAPRDAGAAATTISPLRVEADTRRVYVHGVEAAPPLSNEQFRLLSYLYERSGRVVSREDLVQHVWPDANVEGVSEEALDALVRRVRERIAQAGGERSYIVTLRGHGFRLDAR